MATFDKLFLGPTTSRQFISLDDWVARYAPPDGDLLLQMDIEGAEYVTLNAARTGTLERFELSSWRSMMLTISPVQIHTY